MPELVLLALSGFSVSIAEGDADLVIGGGGRLGGSRVAATRLVALTPREDPNVEASRVVPSGVSPPTDPRWVALEFVSGRPWLLGPLAASDAAALAVAFRAWRERHPIDPEPVEVSEAALVADPHRWHLRRIRVTGTWHCGFEMNWFANAWLVPPDGGHPGTGTYRARAVGTWVYPPDVAYPQYGGMGGSPGELRAESVEILAVSDRGPGTNRDGLTGLLNRRALEVAFGQARDVAHARGEAVSFALLDLDHFKRLNDAYGHPAGDEVLRRCAEALGAAVRAGDLVCRWSGEEFAILMPGAGPDLAREVVGRLLDAVRAVRVPVGEQVAGVTCSAGVTEVRRGATLGEVAQRADLALFDAKRAGRDRLMEA